MRYLRSKRAPYAVPAVAVLAIAAGAMAPSVTGASSPPELPVISPAQLLAEAASAKAPQLTGTLSWTADLGLADLGTIQSDLGAGAGGANSAGFNPLTLVNGTYQINVWLDGSTAEHLSLSPQPGQEVDLVRNGDQAWYWDSTTMKVSHLVGQGASGSAPAGSSVVGALTPQQLADRLLGHIGPTTSVAVPSTVYIGGQRAYELLVTPKSAGGTTIAHIEVDIAADAPLTGTPLQVAVYAAGQASPALELGYTGIQPGPPAASELTFSRPPGATEVTHYLGGPPSTAGGSTGSAAGPTSPNGSAVKRLGSGWTTVVSGTTSVLSNPTYKTELDAVTTVVDVGGQRGRLFTSELVNVLVMPDGHYYAGFVTPAVLEADASSQA